MKKKIIITLIILILVTVAYAADVKWSALVELTTIADSDILCVIDSGTSKKITVLNFFDTIDTSAELLAILTNETGTGALVFATSPTLVTPILGTITSGVGTALTALDGENIQNDTIDDDSIDFADVTGVDLTLTDCGPITSTGTITATVGFDIVGAADADYGSADVTDHTFVTDGTGTAEIVLPAGSIDGTEILDDTVDSGDYNAGSIDYEHLADDTISGAAAVGTFESGDTFLVLEAGVGLREADYDDLPGAAATAYNSIGDPTGAGSITFQDTETATYITETTATDFFEIQATGAFGDISLFRVSQGTGNPTDGALAEFVTADAEDNVDQLLLGNSTDDQATFRIIEAGTLTIDVISDGTPQTQFSDLVTGNAGITVATTTAFSFGANRIDNGSDLIDGEQIANDTIDNDSIDWGDMTDLTTDGALDADVVDEAHIADDGIDSEHYNNGSIDLVHLAAGVYAKDLVTTAPITGAADNIFVGADSDVTVAITLLKDVVATSPVLIDGGTNVDDILPGADADLTISVTVAKDIVTTAPLTGAVDNVIIGTDADITLALDFTAAWDFGGATSVEIPNGADPDVDAAGEISNDTDGANETGDVVIRAFDGTNQFPAGRKLKTLSFTLIEPDQIDAADLIPVWHNTSGMTFTIVEWKAWSDDDNVSLEIEELTDQTDYTAITTVDAVEIATDGTGVFYASDATITHAAIEHDHSIAIDFDATDTPDYVQISITGWFNADVN